MLTIAQCAENLGYNVGGVETNVRELSRRLLTRGYKIEVITSRSPFMQPKMSVNVPVHFSLGLYHVRELVCCTKGPVSELLFHLSEWVYRRTIQRHLKKQYDILHVHEMNTLRAISESGVATPTVVTLYQPVPPRYYQTIQRADVLICRSRQVAEQVKANTGRECIYIPPGCDFQRFRPRDRGHTRTRLGLNPEKTILLYVGRLVPFKNPELLIPALELILRKGLNACLIVIGQGPLRKRLVKLSQRYKIGKHIHFLGNVEPNKLALYYNSADLFVMPSWYESFSQVSLEALVSGTRVLVSSGMVEFHTLFPEVETFSPDSPNELAEKAVALLQQEPLTVPFSRLERFRWSRIVDQHETLYRKFG